MKTILIILGVQTGEYAKGEFNKGLFETAKEHLSKKFGIITTVIKDGYTVDDEITKWKKADYIIYQYSIYWFMMPPILKKYIDDVYAFGAFYEFNDGPYGSGGLMKDKQVMLLPRGVWPRALLVVTFLTGQIGTRCYCQCARVRPIVV